MLFLKRFSRFCSLAVIVRQGLAANLRACLTLSLGNDALNLLDLRLIPVAYRYRFSPLFKGEISEVLLLNLFRLSVQSNLSNVKRHLVLLLYIKGEILLYPNPNESIGA